MTALRPVAALALLLAAARAAAPLDYNRDVKPILAENCFACHGFDEAARKAKLRLDVAADALAPREHGPAIKPGDPAGSEVWRRLTSPHADEVMPPPEAHKRVTAAQRETLRAWIQAGAPYAEHWAFVPPRPAPVPSGEAHPVDAFVRARLAREGLAPAPAADRRTLIRRVSLDLTGLPPAATEVEAFANDPDPRAYDRLVARLLASPHFGERLAVDWLDAARYADTNGFSIDGGRHLWLWRDWVIQAFNDNLPYDRFLVEQLAGDQLPNPSEGQLIATGFQRNNMTTHEGGTIPEENLVTYNADRVKTLGEAVLGLTLACAQCHDHKYDPLTQRDYYGLFAYYNRLGDRGLDGDGGVNAGPARELRTVLRTDEEPALRARIDALRRRLATPDPAVLAAWSARERARIARRGEGFALHPVKVRQASTSSHANLGVEDGRRVLIRQAGDLAAIDVAAELPALSAPVTGVRVVVPSSRELPGGGWGRGPVTRAPAAAKGKGRGKASVRAEVFKGTFRLTALAVSAGAVPGDQVDLHQLRPFAGVTASSWDPAHPPAGCLDPRNDSGWSPDLAATGPVHLTATLASPLRAAETPFLNVQLNFGAGRALLPERIELFVTTGTDDGTDLPAAVVAALGAPEKPESARVLWAHAARHAAELAPARIELANLEERLAALTTPHSTMVMAVAANPRETFILHRGDYAQPGAPVTPGTPAFLPPPPRGAAPDRLGLAQWVVMPGHPLTARVAVNRLWRLLFGTGLVATAMDFGTQGEFPSHPELLDWLAVDFATHGWDVKRLLTLLVTSATYRQDAAATPAQLERDPRNRLLARGPRFRLGAEFVRDHALRVSGLLVPRVGGPSVNPYLPFDLWREVSHYGSTPATAQVFVQDHGEKLYRRSLYTYWKRTAPPPSLAAFDAPNREVCTVERGATTTPLQALVLLNGVQFVEAARAFAERALNRPAAGDDARLRWLFAEGVSRPPAAAELAVLRGTLGRERARYARDPAAATAFLAAGESPRDARLPAPEHAAWAQVATLVLNLSEAITRN